MKFGYARVSTTDQNLEMQIEALKKFGILKVVEAIKKTVSDFLPSY